MAQSGNDGGRGFGKERDPDGGGFIERLADLGKGLDAARARRPEEKDGGGRGSAMGLAFRIATELIAGVAVGAFIGWQLDRWLDTSPFMLLIFFVLGAAAGILNVMRTAHEMQKGAGGMDKGE